MLCKNFQITSSNGCRGSSVPATQQYSTVQQQQQGTVSQPQRVVDTSRQTVYTVQ
ncbi:unnamed protein product, partial [Gongylonema pulchrum]|uniref:YppG-like protein n=1 Tax=Gongylonema pulchrum TaxID=637853 RepID=A0A183F0D8_9BILA